MTKEQLAASGQDDDHPHEHSNQHWTPLTTFFAGTSGLLLILLALAIMKRKEMPPC
jgi:hypothetical protein